MRHATGIVLLLGLVVCGCTTPDPDPVSFPLTGTPAPIAPVKKPQAPPLPPMVYDLAAGVGPVPKELAEKLSEAVTLSTPAGERVWFLKVEGYPAQKGTPGKPWYAVTVHFRPLEEHLLPLLIMFREVEPDQATEPLRLVLRLQPRELQRVEGDLSTERVQHRLRALHRRPRLRRLHDQ